MNLNHLIAETIANHPRDTYQKIARIVCELTEPEDLERFYIAALEPLVAEYIEFYRWENDLR